MCVMFVHHRAASGDIKPCVDHFANDEVTIVALVRFFAEALYFVDQEAGKHSVVNVARTGCDVSVPCRFAYGSKGLDRRENAWSYGAHAHDEASCERPSREQCR